MDAYSTTQVCSELSEEDENIEVEIQWQPRGEVHECLLNICWQWKIDPENMVSLPLFT